LRQGRGAFGLRAFYFSRLHGAQRQKNPSWIAARMGYKAFPTGYDLTQNNLMIAAHRLEYLT
jgi:hypothetical protein